MGKTTDTLSLNTEVCGSGGGGGGWYSVLQNRSVPQTKKASCQTDLFCVAAMKFVAFFRPKKIRGPSFNFLTLSGRQQQRSQP